MAAIVVPFRGSTGKQRLAPAPAHTRSALALAMLTDVVEACVAVGDTIVATSDGAAELVAAARGAGTVPDPDGGQGAAVRAGLAACPPGTVLVVNADLPCVEPRDLLTLLGALPAGGMALVRALDGTTNALALASAALYAPLHGPGSEERFRRHADRVGVAVTLAEIPNLADDVDTLADLERVVARLGPATSAALPALALEPVH